MDGGIQSDRVAEMLNGLRVLLIEPIRRRQNPMRFRGFGCALNGRRQSANRAAHIPVAQGGHSIPDAVVIRRFLAGKLNFEAVYKPLVDAWALYDNSNGEPVLLSWGEK